MPKSQINTDLASQYFATHSDHVYAASDLDHLFIEKHREWNLPPSMTSYTFLQMLLTRTHLAQLRLRSRHYSSLILYSWEGKASPMSVVLRIKKHSAFFSHGSAMWIHRLTENHKNIFLNNEQSPKSKSLSHLSQESIDHAFQNQQRSSRLFYRYQNTRITLINGKHSGRLEVQQSHVPSGHPVEVTSLERTLVDITVRPGYSGGVPAVLQAFRLARGRISVTKLLGILRKLDYTYPYHQSIGFYLERAGHREADQSLAKDLGAMFDFYLAPVVSQRYANRINWLSENGLKLIADRLCK
jgi:hypothetical protein